MPAASSTADYLAIDLGASSGRAVLGSLDGRRVALREIHRFANGPTERPTGLHWDAPRLLDEIKHAILLAGRGGAALAGIGIDTWGVDYALLSESGEMLGLPHHYRDPRTHGLIKTVTARVPRDRIYARTGIQFMELNTLYQLVADHRAGDGHLARARHLLFMPDLFNFWLTGVRRSERTIASTSQLYDTGAGEWAVDLVRSLGLPESILPEVAEPGMPLGSLRSAIAEQLRTTPTTVIAPASHDTASAVAAVPAIGEEWAYISSGTWSLVGRELTGPIRTPAALAANFTNECGVGGTIRFHKNVTGLWLLQECQRHWASLGRTHTFETLSTMAMSAPPLAAAFDPDDPALDEFGDMPARIRALCAQRGHIPPDTEGGLTRAILESLALKCRAVIDTLEDLTGPIRLIHLIGGGAQSPLLCQFTANSAARPVLAGPVEATAMGNILTQALAHQRVSSLSDIRAVVAASHAPTRYEPQDSAVWQEANHRFKVLLRA
jgi:rhamnulokinase